VSGFILWVDLGHYFGARAAPSRIVSQARAGDFSKAVDVV
jgi:hypothetical protein